MIKYRKRRNLKQKKSISIIIYYRYARLDYNVNKLDKDGGVVEALCLTRKVFPDFFMFFLSWVFLLDFLFPFFDSLSELFWVGDQTLIKLKLDPEMINISFALRMLSQDWGSSRLFSRTQVLTAANEMIYSFWKS